MGMCEKSKVLVIDDDMMLLKMAAELLDGRYDVSLAQSGEMALRLLHKGILPDVILLDIDMPCMNGYEVIAEIKKIKEAEPIPIIFLTGLSEAENEIRGLRSGAVDYIKKPFVQEILLARLEVHLDGGRRMREKNSLDEEKLRLLIEPLTETELKVAKLLAQSFTNDEISRELNYSLSYVKKLVSRILSKLNIRIRNEIKQYLK
ncbi:response regulator transcription factor [Desulfosporosinus fructosivorans]|uniref:Stage 0 sporulation protein A homolog n=2 Tax=Desulfosporosinus fructosivorans TaxID=2018669 RepID=A0A4Z0R6Y0_9FIRM|nr:response regulator transcription factor [Desulfosporosinus fructosivorans]